MKKNLNMQQFIQRLKKEVKELFIALLIALLISIPIRVFLVEAYRIPTGSMRPTLLEGDGIMVNKLLYGARVPFVDWRLPALRQPVRGEVVVFIEPQERKKVYIKRLVAFGGETLEIRNGSLYVNGELLSQPEFSKNYYYNRGDYGQAGEKIVVPADTYFVMGDNSGSSQDSRYWGFLPKNNLLGKAIFIWWPFKRMGVLR